MLARTVLATALTALSLAGCVPVVYYRPQAGPGRIEETGCWKLRDTIALDDKHGGAVRVHLDQLWPSYRVVMEFSVLGGNVVELTSPTVGVAFSSLGLDAGGEAARGSWAGRRAVFGPVSGNYPVHAEIRHTGADRVRVTLPPVTVNGEVVTFPDVHFSKAYTVRLVINC